MYEVRGVIFSLGPSACFFLLINPHTSTHPSIFTNMKRSLVWWVLGVQQDSDIRCLFPHHSLLLVPGAASQRLQRDSNWPNATISPPGEITCSQWCVDSALFLLLTPPRMMWFHLCLLVCQCETLTEVFTLQSAHLVLLVSVWGKCVELITKWLNNTNMWPLFLFSSLTSWHKPHTCFRLD